MHETTEDEATRTRRLVMLYGFSGFASNLGSRSLDPVLPLVAADFGTGLSEVALLASAFALPYALIQPVLGPVGDALGKRRVIACACAMVTLSLLGAALAASLGMLFAARVLAGLSAGGIFPLTIATFGDLVPIAHRQVALSRALAFSILGQIAGGALAGLSVGWIGWRGITAVCAAVMGAAALVLWRDLRVRPDAPPGRLDIGTSLVRYRQIAAMPAARRLFASVGTEGVVVFGLFPYIAGLLVAWGLGGTLEAGLALAAFGLAGVVYAALSALLLRRLGLRRMLRLAGALGAAGLSAVALAPGLAGTRTAGVGLVVGGFFLLGLAYFMIHNSLQTRITEVAPGARGSAVALHAFSFFIGQSVGPVLMGALLGAVGARAALLASAAVLLGLGFYVARAAVPPPDPIRNVPGT